MGKEKPRSKAGLGDTQFCSVYPSRISLTLSAAMQRAIAGVGAWQYGPEPITAVPFPPAKLTPQRSDGAICLAGSTLTFAFLYWLSADEVDEAAPPSEEEGDFDWAAFNREHDEWELKYFAEEERRLRTTDPFTD